MVAIRNVMSHGIYVEACVAEQLTTRTVDLEFQGSSLAHQGVCLVKEIGFTLSLVPHTAGGSTCCNTPRCFMLRKPG